MADNVDPVTDSLDSDEKVTESLDSDEKGNEYKAYTNITADITPLTNFTDSDSLLHHESTTLSDLMSKSKNEKITSLGFYQRVPPSLPAQIREHIKHLRLEDVEKETDGTNALKIISTLGVFEELTLCKYKERGDNINMILTAVPSLKKLTLIRCPISSLPESITSMTSLEELDLSFNNLSNDESLNTKLSSLTSLKKLDLSTCFLTKLPQSITSMTSLEELNLSENNLSNEKSLSEKLSYLTSLKKLNLSFCSLTELPQSITSMSSLEELNLSRNYLSNEKSLSEKLSSLTSLKKLDLSRCRLTELPQSITSMTSLEELNLSGNNLSNEKSLSEKLSSLTSLKKLGLSYCRLTELPQSITSMTSLEELDLSWNNLSNEKSLSCKLSYLTSLKKLDLRYCSLTELPESITSMTSLEELYLSRNNLSNEKSLSDKLSSLTSLKKLLLLGCELTGLPQSITSMTSLEELDLSWNNLSNEKSLSEKLSYITSLKELNLSGCKLTELPESITSMTSLEELNLSGNNLSNEKSLSDKSSSLTSLKKLDLSLCSLTELPQSITSMTSLEELNLSDNDLSNEKSLSEKLSHLTSLKKLDLYDCHLTELPQSITSMTSLEELNLSNNNPSNEKSLSEKLSYLTSLKKLGLSECELTELPQSITSMTSLEELDLSDNDLSNNESLSEKLSYLTSLKKLGLSECELTELPQSITSMTSLEELDLSDNDLSNNESLSDKLSSLNKLNLSECSLTELPQSVTSMTSLEELNLSGNDLSNEKSLSDKLSYLTTLKKLDISDCDLTELPERITSMTSLEELNLSLNDLSNEKSLSERLSSLTSLKNLNLYGCKLTELPQSVTSMTSIEELNLSDNTLSNEKSLSDKLSYLTTLKNLNLSGCKLTELPRSITSMTSLRELDLSHNNLSNEKSLSRKLSLTSLKRLNLSECKLTELHESLAGMQHLIFLDVGYNKLSSLPLWIDQLPSLEYLILDGNSELRSLNENVAALPLKRVSCEKCFSLVEPPYAVCKGGIDDIKQYYADLAVGKSQITLCTIALIGRKQAGKSTLVQAMMDGFKARRKKVNKTQVFEMPELTILQSDMKATKAKVIDFGGDEIYHHAYQLTFREDCFPLVVVNIEEYKKESSKWGCREAARRVVFDWVAHLYLARPGLGEPVLVITHQDKFSDDEFNKLKENLLESVDTLKDELLQETDVNIRIFQGQKGRPFFEQKNICVLRYHELTDEQQSDEQGDGFSKLKAIIYRHVNKSEVSVPSSWEKMMKKIKEGDAATLNYTELREDEELGGEGRLQAILGFMHRAGEILWYQEKKPLADDDYDDDDDLFQEKYQGKTRWEEIIFHDISAVTALITTLFHHSIERDAEMGRQSSNPAACNGFMPNGVTTKESLIGNFASSAHQKKIDPDIALQLLEKFKLIYKFPVVRGTGVNYLIPYYMPLHRFDSHSGQLTLDTCLNFVGLPVPAYAYQQMTVSFLEYFVNSSPLLFPYGNGASVKLGSTHADGMIDIHLIHELEAQQARVCVEGQAVDIHQMWSTLEKLVRKLSTDVRKVWPAARIEYDMKCPHCRLIGVQSPATADTSFLKSKQPSKTPSGKVQLEKCGNDSSVPHSLLRPCGELSSDDMAQLSDYIRRVHPDDSAEIQYMLTGLQTDGCIDMSPNPQMSLYSVMSQLKMYKMTETRGRALVINNRHGINNQRRQGYRAGSEYDYRNITKMLEKFGFIISGLSADRDWTARDIVEAVHEETQYIDRHTGASIHSSLGMFVLVMMSHGDYGTICGEDGIQVKLTDIYSLLSSRNFPAMRGKPKLVILQACSGVKTESTDVVTRVMNVRADNSATDDTSDDAVPSASNHPSDQPPAKRVRLSNQSLASSQSVQSNQPQAPPRPAPPPPPPSSPPPAAPQTQAADDSFLTMDDLLVMKPSFDDYVSWRMRNTGSFFIRTLVTTFYMKAGSKHLVELSDLIQEIVRKETIEKEKDSQKILGQIPVTVCTFTNARKLYLSPGVNMRTTHPESLADPVLPYPRRSRINIEGAGLK